MTYAEQVPPADLRPFVRAFWWRTEDAAASAPIRVLPDGCADLLIDQRDEVARDRRLRWVGTMTRARLVEASPAARGVLFRVRFEPGALAAFVRAPVGSVTDADAPFGALEGEGAVSSREPPGARRRRIAPSWPRADGFVQDLVAGRSSSGTRRSR